MTGGLILNRFFWTSDSVLVWFRFGESPDRLSVAGCATGVIYRLLSSNSQVASLCKRSMHHTNLGRTAVLLVHGNLVVLIRPYRSPLGLALFSDSSGDSGGASSTWVVLTGTRRSVLQRPLDLRGWLND
jgi:hypothetical protein